MAGLHGRWVGHKAALAAERSWSTECGNHPDARCAIPCHCLGRAGIHTHRLWLGRILSQHRVLSQRKYQGYIVPFAMCRMADSFIDVLED